jgi:hypothetical protein
MTGEDRSLLAPLYGRRPRGRVERLLCGRRWFLMAALVPVVLGVFALLLVAMVVDPYDVRPWGLPPRIADHRYPDIEWPLLIKVVSQGDYDTVLFGASTMMAVEPAQLRAAFGDQAKVVNLSYLYASSGDTAESLRFIAGMPNLKHLILSIDHTQMLAHDSIMLPARIRANALSSSWAHAGDFMVPTIRASWQRLVSGTYDLPEWRALKRPGFLARATPISAQPETIMRLRKAVAAHRTDVLGGQAAPCASYPFIERTLLPSLRQLADRGVQIDLVFPPYPIVAYYDWIERRVVNDPFPPGPVFQAIAGFKRCAVEAASGFGKNVRVHAVDTDTAITGNLANYWDSLHLLEPEAYQRVLDDVASGQYELTVENFSAYQRRMEELVMDLPL